MKTPKQIRSLLSDHDDGTLSLFYFLYYTGCLRVYQRNGTVVQWCAEPRKWNPIFWGFVIVTYLGDWFIELWRTSKDVLVEMVREWKEDDPFGPSVLRDVQYGDAKLFGYDDSNQEDNNAIDGINDVLYKVMLWLVTISIIVIIIHGILGCSDSSYPNQHKVVKQDTYRYNEKVGR